VGSSFVFDKVSRFAAPVHLSCLEAEMAELDAGSAQRPRPLSPHLQIYKLTLTMVMSIVHRITGAALYFGTLLLAWWLIAAASGPNAYANFEWFIGSLIGRLILLGYTWALLHHMLGGIRHLIWDTIHGFEPAERELLTLATLVSSVALTLVLWAVGYLAMGGPR
jgi:succinate dehydrogenase / fumarate reductase cytochrome b subunit